MFGQLKMKRFLLIIALLLAAPSFAKAQTTTAAFNGYCTLGAAFSRTSGLPSSNYLQGIIPQCKVTVYLTGTLTLATIYANAGSGSLTNPFTANTTGSWLFFAAEGQGYDVVMSGGFPPNNYPVPVTLTDLIVGGGGGGSGVTVCAPVNAIQIANVGATNLTCDPEITENTSTHSIYVGGPVAGFSVNIGARSVMPATWNLDTTTGLTAIDSMTGPSTPNFVWTWNGSTGQWLPSNLSVVQVNGTPLTSQNPVNFINSGSVTFSNPSAGVITAVATAPGVTFQHDTVPLVLQNLINYSDTSPAAIAGYANALFQSNSGGDLSVEYQLASSQIQQLVNIPSIMGLQAMLVPFRTAVVFGVDATNIAVASPTSGYVSHSGCGPWNPSGNCSAGVGFTVSNAVLPTSIPPSSVAQVWPVVVASSPGSYGQGYDTSIVYQCTNPSGGSVPQPINTGSLPFPLQQFQALDSGVTGAQIPSITCTMNLSAIDPVQTGIVVNAPYLALIVYYTGATPPISNSINVVPPLFFNPTNNLLSLTIPNNYSVDSGTSGAAYSISQLFYSPAGIQGGQAQPGTEINFLPNHTNSSTTPTLTYVGNNIGPTKIIKAGGGALAIGDIVAGAGDGGVCCTAKVILNANNQWELQNPQTVQSAVRFIGTTGTITGTSLSASCDSGPASVPGAAVGEPVAVSSTTGADVGGAFSVRGSVTSPNVVTVYVCGTGTPASLAYNVTVTQ